MSRAILIMIKNDSKMNTKNRWKLGSVPMQQACANKTTTSNSSLSSPMTQPSTSGTASPSSHESGESIFSPETISCLPTDEKLHSMSSSPTNYDDTNVDECSILVMEHNLVDTVHS